MGRGERAAGWQVGRGGRPSGAEAHALVVLHAREQGGPGGRKERGDTSQLAVPVLRQQSLVPHQRVLRQVCPGFRRPSRGFLASGPLTPRRAPRPVATNVSIRRARAGGAGPARCLPGVPDVWVVWVMFGTITVAAIGREGGGRCLALAWDPTSDRRPKGVAATKASGDSRRRIVLVSAPGGAPASCPASWYSHRPSPDHIASRILLSYSLTEWPRLGSCYKYRPGAAPPGPKVGRG